jgi:hypothetical protein
MRKLFLCVGLSCLGLLAGCGGGSAASSPGSGNQGGPGPVVLKSIAITPSNATILPFTTKQFSATGKYSDGTTKDLTSQVAWNSTPSTVVNISNSAPTVGVVQGLTPPTGVTCPCVSVITAALGSVASVTQVTVSSATLTSIAVTDATGSTSPNISLGAQLQFKAIATFSDGTLQGITTQDVTNVATWTFDTPGIATITTGTGLATAVGVGTTNISAALCVPNPPPNPPTCTSGSSAETTAMLTVNADNLVSLAVEPSAPSIAQNTKLQFSVIGHFTDGSTRDLTSQVAAGTWASADTTVASISPTGLATARKFKSAKPIKITASVSFTLPSAVTCTDTSQPPCPAALTVTNATLQSITVSPSTASIALGTKVAFTALGTFSDSTTGAPTTTTQDLTNQVGWQAASTSTSTNTCGNATISRLGVATDTTDTTAETCAITATSSGQTIPPSVVSLPATLMVTSATLTSIAITPATPVVAPGSTLQLVATGTFTDPSTMKTVTQDITNAVVWSSSDLTIVSPVNPTGAVTNRTGVVTGEGIGSAFITATVPANPVTGSPAVSSPNTSVLVEPLKSLAITAPSPSFAAGSSIQLTATGTFADGNTQDFTASAIWSTSAPAVATVGSTPGTSGEVTGLTAGPVTVTAGFNGVTATLPLTVATLTSITVTDASSFNITSGSSDQLTATATLSDKTTQDLTGDVTWSSSNAGVAVVDSDGLATGTGKGSSTVTATFNQTTSVTGTATLTVH